MTTPQAESDKASAGSAPPAVAQDATSSESLDATPTTSWAHHYTALTSRLPTPIASRLPTASSVSASSSQLSSQLSSTSARLGEVATSTSARLSDLGRQGTVKLKESKALQKLDPDGFLTNAYSVTNTTQVALNISLNQVSPLMFAVVLPNETFERRVPNVWFVLQIRPHTSKDDEYTRWSTTWPILALAGPVAAATSLLLVPFVAVAAGGAALASLTGFAAESATAVMSATGTAAGLVAKSAHLPGASKVRGKLVDAARSTFGVGTKEEAANKVIKYLVGGATAAGAGVGRLQDEGEGERGRKKEKEKKRHRLAEVEVTGYELEKVLKCETGKKKVDKALTEAFTKLTLKTTDFKASMNPVLNIVGGPELEIRGKHSYLVFYPISLEVVADITAEPLPATDFPPTEEESLLINDAAVVASTEEAEEVAKLAPMYEGGKRGEVEQVVKNVEAKNGDGKGAAAGWFGSWGRG